MIDRSKEEVLGLLRSEKGSETVVRTKEVFLELSTGVRKYFFNVNRIEKNFLTSR